MRSSSMIFDRADLGDHKIPNTKSRFLTLTTRPYFSNSFFQHFCEGWSQWMDKVWADTTNSSRSLLWWKTFARIDQVGLKFSEYSNLGVKVFRKKTWFSESKKNFTAPIYDQNQTFNGSCTAGVTRNNTSGDLMSAPTTLNLGFA